MSASIGPSPSHTLVWVHPGRRYRWRRLKRWVRRHDAVGWAGRATLALAVAVAALVLVLGDRVGRLGDHAARAGDVLLDATGGMVHRWYLVPAWMALPADKATARQVVQLGQGPAGTLACLVGPRGAIDLWAQRSAAQALADEPLDAAGLDRVLAAAAQAAPPAVLATLHARVAAPGATPTC